MEFYFTDKELETKPIKEIQIDSLLALKLKPSYLIGVDEGETLIITNSTESAEHKLQELNYETQIVGLLTNQITDDLIDILYESQKEYENFVILYWDETTLTGLRLTEKFKKFYEQHRKKETVEIFEKIPVVIKDNTLASAMLLSLNDKYQPNVGANKLEQELQQLSELMDLQLQDQWKYIQRIKGKGDVNRMESLLLIDQMNRTLDNLA